MVIQALNWIYGIKASCCEESKKSAERAFNQLKEVTKETEASTQRINQATAIVILGNEEVDAAISEYKRKESGEHKKVD